MKWKLVFYKIAGFITLNLTLHAYGDKPISHDSKQTQDRKALFATPSTPAEKPFPIKFSNRQGYFSKEQVEEITEVLEDLSKYSHQIKRIVVHTPDITGNFVRLDVSVYLKDGRRVEGSTRVLANDGFNLRSIHSLQDKLIRDINSPPG